MEYYKRFRPFVKYFFIYFSLAFLRCSEYCNNSYNFSVIPVRKGYVMNSRQLQYAIMLSEIRNFSQVAEKLKISQPALSKQILSLENELGIKLFDRTTAPLTVTPAGQHFIRGAADLVYKEDQLLRSLERFKSGEAGQLVIGVTPFRSSYLIPDMVKVFRAAYPHIQVKLHEAGSDLLRKEAAEGKFDFAVVNLPVDESALDVIPLESDRLVLVLPSEYQHLLAAPKDCREVDFRACKDIPFVVVQKTQEMRLLFEKLCASHNFHPNIAAEVVGLTTAWAMACAGVAATILPLQFVKHNDYHSNVSIVSIQDTVYIRQPAIVTKRGQYLSDAAKYAISLLAKGK